MAKFDAVRYWQRRYKSGGSSGNRDADDEENEAQWISRAERIHELIAGRPIRNVLDIGSGDGRQAVHLDLPGYLGIDPSPKAVELARQNCPTKNFEVSTERVDPRDLHLSLDVMFHLISNDDYRAHLALLFSARQLVIVHASDHDEQGAAHVRHRHWTKDVPRAWRLVESRPSQPETSVLTLWERTKGIRRFLRR